MVVALQNPEASDWHTQLLLSAGEAAHAAILCSVCRLGEGDALLRPAAQGVATFLGSDGSYSCAIYNLCHNIWLQQVGHRGQDNA